MGTFILIIVMGFSTHHSGGIAIQQEFSTLALCQQAQKTITDDVAKSSNRNAKQFYPEGSNLVTHGCYKK